MNDSPDRPPRYELKKYQAGYGLLILAALVGWLAYSFDIWQAYLITAFLGVTGIVFQFDRTRPSRKRGSRDQEADS